MNKTVERILLFFVGVPLIVFIALLKVCFHLPLHILILACAAIAASEMHNMLEHVQETQNKAFVAVLTCSIPLATACSIFFNLANNVIVITGVTAAFISMAKEVFFSEKDDETFTRAVPRILSTAFTIFYCGYLTSFIARITAWEHSQQALVVFLLFVFGCDSFAWVFGMLFGKNNRGIFKASPNKSIAGFAGGIGCTVLIGYAVWLLVPFYHEQSLAKMLILALSCSLTAICGDLAESVMKRSTHIKDSGWIIPGRGGLLDSIDSILFTAPVYYLLSSLFFGL